MSEHRTQTKSEVKWLANELAMLAGEIEKVDRETVRLAERRCALVATRDQLSRVAALAEVPASLQLLKPVRAHPHYGGRGNLRDFLRETLREAYPRAMDSHTMAELAVQHFTEAFDSKLSWERFRMRRVPDTLRKLVLRGEVERLHDLVTTHVGCWRWNAGLPSFDDLRRMEWERAWP